MDKPYLHIKNLKVNFKNYEGTKTVLDIDEIKVNKGEAFGIIGESGTGKTVLALSILRLLEMPPGKIESGEILLNGDDLLKKTVKQMEKEVRGKKISMIFQDPMSTLNPVFTVGEQIIKVITENQGMNKKAAYGKAVEMLKLVELPDAERVMDKYPHELSGGQRQRIIIALALSCGAEFIIADEPTRNLDVTIQAGILKLIKELQKTLNVTVLFIANNPGLISATCDNTAVLYKGTIVEQGRTKDVLRNPRHPYTFTLLHAIPRNKKEKIDLNKVFSLHEELSPEGACIYYGKCINKSQVCKNNPQNIIVGENHYVRCSLANTDESWKKAEEESSSGKGGNMRDKTDREEGRV